METYRVKICDSEEAGKNTEEKTREETGKLLQIARNDNTSSSLKKLKELSGGK
jgi:hypothetical protein